MEARHRRYEPVRANEWVIETASRPLALFEGCLQAGGFGTVIAPTDRRNGF